LPDVEELRERGREIKQRTIDDLDRYLDEFSRALEARGGHVHFAATAGEAADTIRDICRRGGARLVAKSKSMASEEIRLNEALERDGLRVVETDLGEYILQLAGEHPAHIIAPAIEKTAVEVAALLGAVDGSELRPELEELTAAARRQLRAVFETADVGITGANFAVAETGSIVLVTNEGNGRLVSALPRTHVVILGMERLVPTTRDLGVLLRLLARSATGQKLTTYTTVLTGPRRPGEQDGPDELHVIVLDNGRSQLRRGRYREMLNCIRCGACLNVCPVYRKSGGDAYGPVYSGPMGAVLVPLLVGLEHAPSLPHASSLCGACAEACPVKIPYTSCCSTCGATSWRSAWRRSGSGWLSVSGPSPGRRPSATGSRRPPRALVRRWPAAAGPRPRLGVAAHAAPARAPPIPRPPPMNDLVELFAENAAAAGFTVHREGDAPEESSRALYGLADTGSVVLAASPEEPRARSLLPFRHWTLVERDRILPGLDELFTRLGTDLPSALAIVTGPSRSADIEQRLAVGVHGPGDVHVLIL
jgi:iron-sulfur cluster protein